MANVSQTAANVKIGGEGTTTRQRQAGEAITQGMPYYISSGDNKAYQTDANDTAAKAEAKGIALTPASTNGYFIGLEDGPVDVGATLSVGGLYVVSATKGAIAPVADLTTNDYVTTLGVAISASVLDLNIQVSGIQKA